VNERGDERLTLCHDIEIIFKIYIENESENILKKMKNKLPNKIPKISYIQKTMLADYNNISRIII